MKQRWDMKQSSSDGGLGNGAPTEGEGDPTKVANTACSIVKGNQHHGALHRPQRLSYNPKRFIVKPIHSVARAGID
jgi:hypothetical protein